MNGGDDIARVVAEVTVASRRTLAALPEESVRAFQPHWALAAHLLERMNRVDEAVRAYDRAIGLSMDPAKRAFLEASVQRLRGSRESA